MHNGTQVELYDTHWIAVCEQVRTLVPDAELAIVPDEDFGMIYELRRGGKQIFQAWIDLCGTLRTWARKSTQ